MTGRTISHYEFLERLGSGGMGEIFRARDTRLNRMVAVKVLPKSDSGDQTPRLRFMQEARAASGLSHPNIVTVHDILADDGSDLLVMELVSGRTIAQMVSGGGLPIPLVLKYAVQTASALAAAHAAGIVHRDVKPGNIMVTGSGLVKVLDFGLAKPTYTGLSDDSAKTASISGPLTVRGTVVGTVNYMSPEQAEGKSVDARSDIFSFGILLYEMATGRRAFPGESAIATMTAILRDDVRPLRELAPSAPARLQEIVGRCLRKNRDERWQTMDEVLAALEILKLQYDSGSAPTVLVPVPPSRSRGMLVAAAAICIALLVAGGVTWWAVARRNARRQAASPPAVSIQVAGQTAAAPDASTAGAAVPPPNAVTPAPPADEAAPLTNDAIVQMLEAKVPAAVIMGHIRSSKTQFDLSTAEVIRLSRAGATEPVIQAMRDASRPAGAKPAAIPPAPPAPVKQADQAPSASRPATPPPPAPPPAPAPNTAAGAPPAVPPSPQAASPAGGAGRPIAISDGAPVTIELAADIPLEARAGTPLKFTVAQNVMAGDYVVIAKGSQVAGRVVDEAGKKSRLKVWASDPKMTFQVEQVEAVSGQKLRLRATASTGGASGRRAVDSATYSESKKKPKDLAAAAGAQYVVYIDGSQSVSVRK